MPRKSKRVEPLTKSLIQSLPAPANGRAVIWDEATPHLCIRITDKGVKSFYWVGRSSGRPQWIHVGVWPSMNVVAARKEAERLTGDAVQGKAVIARGKAHRGEWTLGELWSWYFKNESRPHKRTWKWDLRQWETRLKQWENRKVSTLTRVEIQDHHLAIGAKNGPYAGNKLLELLGTMYRKGNIADPVCVPCADPCRGITRFQRHERERYLDDDELPVFIDAVGRIKSETCRDFLMLCLWTGARRGNVMAMKWADIKMNRGTWTIEAAESKNKRTMTIMLSPQAIAILKRRRKTKRGKWVLPGRGKAGHYSSPKDAIAQVKKLSGLEDIRIHDLRRTLGSWLGMNNPLQTVASALGHRSIKSAQVYSRLAQRRLANSIADATAAMQGAGRKK